MALETAVGAISLVEDLAANTLADCPPFQDFLGVANKTLALAEIHFGAMDLPGSGADGFSTAELIAQRPFAMLWQDEGGGLTFGFSGHGASWNLTPTSGRIIVRLEKAAGSGTPSEEDRAFKNEVGLILRSGDAGNPGLAERSGESGYMAFHRMTCFGPWRASEEEAQHYGDHFAARIELEWGVRQR